jgi:dihydroxyacid dehydratase/phosphogluconate dehydratase
MLVNRPSGDIFGMTMNAGMGWSPDELNRDGILLLSTLGGLRGPDGKPVALALHQGHYELDIQMKAAADVIKHNNALPYAVYVSDPCDGRTQGTTGMFDSLPYRNDASMVMRRLIRSLPDAKAVIGVATCDKGLPATMMALASQHDKATVLIPGGATLPALHGEDNGKVQTIGARFANGELSLQGARRGMPGLRVIRRRLSVPGHGGHLAGGGRRLRAGYPPLRAGAIRRAGVAGNRPSFRPRGAATDPQGHHHEGYPHR